MFCFQIFRKWHVLPSLDLSILLENMNCSRKICELYEKKWIVPEKKFSGTIHIFSYNWQIFLEQFIFSDKIDRSRGGTTCYFLQKFIIYYRPVYTSIIQQMSFMTKKSFLSLLECHLRLVRCFIFKVFVELY